MLSAGQLWRASVMARSRGVVAAFVDWDWGCWDILVVGVGSRAGVGRVIG